MTTVTEPALVAAVRATACEIIANGDLSDRDTLERLYDYLCTGFGVQGKIGCTPILPYWLEPDRGPCYAIEQLKYNAPILTWTKRQSERMLAAVAVLWASQRPSVHALVAA